MSDRKSMAPRPEDRLAHTRSRIESWFRNRRMMLCDVDLNKKYGFGQTVEAIEALMDYLAEGDAERGAPVSAPPASSGEFLDLSQITDEQIVQVVMAGTRDGASYHAIHTAPVLAALRRLAVSAPPAPEPSEAAIQVAVEAFAHANDEAGPLTSRSKMRRAIVAYLAVDHPRPDGLTE